ncbi:MAG: ribonuclease HI family protein [Planctomycetota bacterium]
MDKRALLKAIYRALQWDKVYEALPGVTRQEVDELFQELGEGLSDVPEPPEELAAKIAGGEAHLYCDGASRGNPGPAGVGMVITTAEGGEVLAWGAAIGKATNNVAEYRAAIEGLKKALGLQVGRVCLLTDSELLIRQLRGEYKVKNAGLKPLHAEASALLKQFGSWEAQHIPRDENKKADALAARYAKEARKTGAAP